MMPDRATGVPYVGGRRRALSQALRLMVRRIVRHQIDSLTVRLTIAGGALALLLLAGCDPSDATAGSDATVSTFEASVPSDFISHQGRDVKVELKAPQSWKPTPTSGTVQLNLHTDQPQSSLNVVVVPAQPGETLDKTMSKLPADLDHEFADFRLIKHDYLILRELPAGRLVYEASRGGFHGKLMQVFMTRGGSHYIFTYTSTPDAYDREIATVEEVLASWQLP